MTSHSHFRGSLFRILISICAIGLICYFMRGKIGEAMLILRKDVQWNWFFLAILAYFSANAVQAIRFKCIFRAQGIIIAYWESLYLCFLGLFFNLFLPSAIGGDIVKAFYAYKHTGKKIESMSAVFQDRLVGFMALIGMALAALGFVSKEFHDVRVNEIVYIFLAVMLFAMFFFWSRRFANNFRFVRNLIPSPKWRERVGELYHAVYSFKYHKMIFLKSIILSFVAQAIFITIHYLAALSLNVDISIWVFFLVVPVISIVTMAPSVGGLGVREASVIFFLKHFMPSERALALSILLDMLIYGFSLVAGIIFAFHGGLKPKVIHEMEELEP